MRNKMECDCSKGPHMLFFDDIVCMYRKVVFDSVLLSPFKLLWVILLIAKHRRGFGFHILESVPLNYLKPILGFSPKE